MKKLFLLLAIFIVILFIITSIFPLKNTIPQEVLQGKPTNFVQVGVLTFPEVNQVGQSAPYLSYVSSTNAPTITIKLLLDAESVCASSAGALPCMAMSVDFRTAFGGKRAIVEGIEKEDELLVRKLRVLEDGDPGLAPGPGLIYIPWPQAVELIKKCIPTMVMQTHSLNVSLTLPDGSVVHSVESTIDEVFEVLNETSGRCGNIPIATE
jgi:hypothetical protein